MDPGVLAALLRCTHIGAWLLSYIEDRQGILAALWQAALSLRSITACSTNDANIHATLYAATRLLQLQGNKLLAGW